MATPRQHAASPVSERPDVPETSLAERARTLVFLGRVGSLATHSRRQPGFPFGSVMPFAPDEHGRPVLLISSMAMHTQNLKADSRASLLVMQEGGQDPLGAARATVIGEVRPVPAEETGTVRDLYLVRHEDAHHWIDFADFSFYRLEPVDIYYVGGFGVMGWVTAAEYAVSEPDPLAESADGIMRHMNQDHGVALVSLARTAGESDTEVARMTAIDRLGFHLQLRGGGRVRGVRIGFPRQVRNSAEARLVLGEMVHDAG